MQTLNDALYQLYMSREVTADECLRVSGDPNEFLRMIGQPVLGDEGYSRREGQVRRARPAKPQARHPPPGGSSTRTLERRRNAHVYLYRAHAQRRPQDGDDRCRARATTSSRSSAGSGSTSSRSTRTAQERRAGGRIKMRDIVIFTRQFSTMINAGLPLVQALDILAKQSENKALKDVTTPGRVRRRVGTHRRRRARASTRRRSPTCT